MRTHRHVVLGGLVLVFGVVTAMPVLAQCSATITVQTNTGPVAETLTGSCTAELNGLHNLGPIRIQQFNWVSQSDAAGGYRFDLHAIFMNDVDTVPRNITVVQTVTNLPTGMRRWYSSYSGEAHETPGPSGTASDGTLFVTPNHMDSTVGGVPVGNFDYPINDTPSPVSNPFGCLELADCLAGPVMVDSNVGVINLNMTLGRGDVNNLKHTASIMSPSNSAVPAMSTWGLLAVVLALGASGLYLISRWSGPAPLLP